jgi:hypothetical protein
MAHNKISQNSVAIHTPSVEVSLMILLQLKKYECRNIQVCIRKRSNVQSYPREECWENLDGIFHYYGSSERISVIFLQCQRKSAISLHTTLIYISAYRV